MMKKIFLLTAIILPLVYISCSDDKDEPVTPEEHEWVDLGLPSGPLWATCNVGANAPEEYGDYFAWGETTPKEVYYWSNYKWCNGNELKLTKYCTESKYGFVDHKTQLDQEDDAAYVNWGASWRMPTKEQENELIDKCTWTETTQNDVYGLLVTGPNGNTIFLPATGGRFDDGLYHTGSHGGYWSRTLYEYASNESYGLFFGSGRLDWNSYRDNGFTVRAVRVSQD